MPEEKAPSSGSSCQHRRCIFAPASRRIFAPALTPPSSDQTNLDLDVFADAVNAVSHWHSSTPGKHGDRPLMLGRRHRLAEGQSAEAGFASFAVRVLLRFVALLLASCDGRAFAPPRERSGSRGFAFGCLQGAYNFEN